MRILVVAAMTAALASGQEAHIRADMRGGGDSGGGKCTGEVDVDGVVEIALRGEEGSIRTLAGQPGRWKRLQCSGPMPRSMSDFRFKGVDGRGRQELARDPRSNNGVAVIRIEDSKGGSEGYTFDVEWRIGGGSWGSGSNNNNNQGGWGNSGGGSGWGNSNQGGWGNSNQGGWGNGNQGGWNNNWGSGFVHRGRGSGSFSHSNGQRQDLRGVYVTMDRGTGMVEVRLDTNVGKEALVVMGRARQINGDTVVAEITSARNQGETVNASGSLRMTIGGDRRVRNIVVDGRAAGGRFNLDYRE